MINIENILALLGAYLLGSIPTAVWIGKYFYNIDVREYGSGNAGATNVFRVLGKKAGVPVLLIDVLKGFLAVSLAYTSAYPINSNPFINLQLVLGIASLVGHIFPVFASFRGGKGIATLLGMAIGIDYALALACIALFLLVLLLTKYVSLSSILATVSFPVFAIFFFKRDEPLLIAFGIVAIIIVVLTHQKNIKKLWEGEENKANLFKKKA